MHFKFYINRILALDAKRNEQIMGIFGFTTIIPSLSLPLITRRRTKIMLKVLRPEKDASSLVKYFFPSNSELFHLFLFLIFSCFFLVITLWNYHMNGSGSSVSVLQVTFWNRTLLCVLKYCEIFMKQTVMIILLPRVIFQTILRTVNHKLFLVILFAYDNIRLTILSEPSKVNVSLLLRGTLVPLIFFPLLWNLCYYLMW